MIILGYFFLFLSEALLMSTHNICFYGKLEKMIPELSSIILLNNYHAMGKFSRQQADDSFLIFPGK